MMPTAATRGFGIEHFDDPNIRAVSRTMGAAAGSDSLPLGGRAGQIQSAMRPLRNNEPVLENRYLVEGLLDRGTFSVVFGAPGSGKTFAALELAIHVAARKEWRGLRVGGQATDYDWPGPVFYLALEGGRGVQNRLAALKIEKPDVYAAASEDDMFTVVSLPMDFHSVGDAEALVDVLYQFPTCPGLIVIDTLARAMGAGDENSAAEMGQLIRNLDRVREATGAHIMVVHHSGKDATRGARGSSALKAALDTEIEIVQNRGIITIADRKQRDGECGFERHFTLKQVEVGRDETGKSVTSAVLVETATAFRKPNLTGPQEVALKALTEALKVHGRRMGDDAKYPDCKVVSEADWRAACDRQGLTDSDKADTRKKAFNRARNTLIEKGIVDHFEGMVWKVANNEK